MNSFSRIFILLSGTFIFSISLQAQTIIPANAAQIQNDLYKLNTLGSVLYFAAHPDDENTKLIAWLAQEKHYKTGYLSLTRGDGGQNLIGNEQGEELGLIRTQELLAARAEDKGVQFFSTAFDFGFSKTPDETFLIWDKHRILADAVWVIRKFQPDVIITRFPPDPRAGHGHHQASAILAKEAFEAAGDPKMFPEQLKYVKPWKAKRLLWNAANFGGFNNTNDQQLKINTGDYNPLLGKSFGEIAAMSRTFHKSQAFGTALQRGDNMEYFELVAGEKAEKTLLDGVNTTWSRLGNTHYIQQLIDQLISSYSTNEPEKSVPLLNRIYTAVQSLPPSLWKTEKLDNIKMLIAQCVGIVIESNAAKQNYASGEVARIKNTIIVRSKQFPVVLEQINNIKIDQKLPYNQNFSLENDLKVINSSQPYWLRQQPSKGRFHVENVQEIGNPENVNDAKNTFQIAINGVSYSFEIPVVFKKIDPVWGELNPKINVSDTLLAYTSENLLILNQQESQKFTVTYEAPNVKDSLTTKIIAKLPSDWTIHPKEVTLTFSASNAKITQEYRLSPAKTIVSKLDTLIFQWNNKPLRHKKTITYHHIPEITYFPQTNIKLSQFKLTNNVKNIAYLNGAGDQIPGSLRAIQIKVDEMNEQQFLTTDLAPYDAVVIGIRAFNIFENSSQLLSSLLRYVENGGTALVQYNVNSNLKTPELGPFPFSLSKNRVTEEDAAVKIDKSNPSMNFPNKLTAADFDYWIQERGLYFAEKIDKRYQTPLIMHDQNEEPQRGALLITPYGKGKFVYTSLSFFRELPAGVPGAYRLFINLLTNSK